MQTMARDYRQVLAGNLRRCLEHAGKTRDTLRAPYLDGTKKGETVSARTITNMLDPDAHSPSLDAVAAVAAALGELMPWQLLVPGLDPTNPPTIRLTAEERKLHEEFQRLREQTPGGRQAMKHLRAFGPDRYPGRLDHGRRHVRARVRQTGKRQPAAAKRWSPSSSGSCRPATRKVPDWPELANRVRKKVLEKGYTYQSLEQVAKEAAEEAGMTR